MNKTPAPEEIPVKERVRMLRTPFYVETNVSNDILSRMTDIFNRPKRSRMQSLLILGHPNNGKTSLLKRFAQLNTSTVDPEDYGDRMPVVSFELGDSRVSRFYDNALRGMKVTPVASHKSHQKEAHFLQVCKALDVRVLVIDEFHNGYEGSAREQLRLLTLIRNVTNTLEIPLILAGIGTAKTFLFSDPQLSTRFKQVTIPLWKDDANFRGFLRAIETIFALRKESNLATDPHLPKQILMMTEGLTGEVTDLLTEAAVKAVETGEERISMELVKSIEWTKPSERRN